MPVRMTDTEAFRQLAKGISHSGATDFFDTLVKQLAQLLSVDHALIARVHEGEAHTLTIWSQGRHLTNCRYALADTPCEAVANQKACLHSHSVQEYFPHDVILQELGADSYLGVPLFTTDGALLGLLAVLDNRPMTPSDQDHELLHIAATQAGAELGRREAEQALQASERRLETLLNNLPGMAYRCLNDANWTMLLVSQGTAEVTGYPAEAFTQHQQVNLAALTHPDDRRRVEAAIQEAIARHEPFRVVYRLQTADRGTRWMWEQGQVIFDSTGQVDCLEGFITDITEQREVQRVQEAVTLVASTVSNRVGDEYFCQLARTLVRLLEADAGLIARLEPATDSTETATTPDHGGELDMSLISAIVDGQPLTPYRLALTDTPGEALLDTQEVINRQAEASHLPGIPADTRAWIGRRLDNAQGNPIGIIMVFYRQPPETDVFATSVLRILSNGAAAELERRNDHQRMHQLAYTDATTGLPNRVHFMEALIHQQQAAECEQTQLALVLIDIRRFKEINDTHGYQIGDRLLAALAERLRQVSAPHESLARLGNDEFALILPRASTTEAIEDYLARMRHAIGRPINLDHHRFSLTMSIGTAQYPGDATSPEELFKCASIALYYAKRHACDACHFDAGMTRALQRRQRMAERLHLAIGEGRLELYYQPKFDLANGSLVGAEALCRWHDEEWGWISPSEFIPLAEERGLINQLGDWVLKESARQLSTWRRDGMPLPGRLSINVAAQQFADPDLAQRISALTRDTPASTIDLELTESDVMRDAEQAIETTRSLREIGYTLSIDDFGTGYSSLAYLRRFAADTLKIDLSFIRKMLDGPHDHAIVETIIAMARSLGMQTVAEGVETPEQAQELARLGCDQAQGFYFGRPISSGDFAAAWHASMTVR